MKQRLLAVAVAGAFAAPAVAFAQNSTVQIYGTINAEYGFAKGTNTATGKTNNWDGLNSGASNIGFKGEEKLGGGMSAFFQCETQVGFLDGSQGAAAGFANSAGGWCNRNSALGLKGGFGSFFIGVWDSPTKQAVASTRIVGETGWLGVQTLLLSNGGGFAGTFSARNSNSLNYNSPKFGGFSFAAQTTSTKAAATTTTAGLKGRATSFNLKYDAGPLDLVIAHTVLDDNRSKAGLNGTEDKAWVLGGTYSFGKALVGLTYVDAETDTAIGASTERKSWNLAGSYDLAGPGSIWAGYTRAGDAKTSVGGGANTGAKEYQIGYKHTMSKRTFAAIGYGRVKNDSAATGYSIGAIGAGAGALAGNSSSVLSIQLQHKF